ncbi:hypothetical protein VIGAN_04038600 [Vigna angularis var. angularis]|uniref:Uncharacterized protein n=1 Tax=Vigna angularis var. angularis TaxID=157739 RepID=A0A0S3RRQ4_PHAAN|nr:hypothetical protein VIGAN_04038600 [Vigna angularis var. angularis]
MKRQASTRLLMWVMICLQVYLIIAAVSLSESNDSTSVCNGSVEDCLRLHHLDSQLPTVSSSHFQRMLAEANDRKTTGTGDPNNPFFKCPSADTTGNAKVVIEWVIYYLCSNAFLSSLHCCATSYYYWPYVFVI